MVLFLTVSGHIGFYEVCLLVCVLLSKGSCVSGGRSLPEMTSSVKSSLSTLCKFYARLALFSADIPLCIEFNWRSTGTRVLHACCMVMESSHDTK